MSEHMATARKNFLWTGRNLGTADGENLRVWTEHELAPFLLDRDVLWRMLLTSALAQQSYCYQATKSVRCMMGWTRVNGDKDYRVSPSLPYSQCFMDTNTFMTSSQHKQLSLKTCRQINIFTTKHYHLCPQGPPEHKMKLLAVALVSIFKVDSLLSDAGFTVLWRTCSRTLITV